MNGIKLIQSAVISVLILLMSGCSMFSPVQSNYTTYVLNASPSVPRRANHNEVLFVSQVTADPLYNTSEMAYTSSAYKVEYFAKNKWADEPAKMLQPLILQTLRDTHRFRAVTSSTNAVRSDYVLNVDLIELRQVFLAKSAYVVFEINAEIINARTGRIIATRRLSAEEGMQCMTPYSGVAAANRAVAVVLRKLASFCTNAI